MPNINHKPCIAAGLTFMVYNTEYYCFRCSSDNGSANTESLSAVLY